MFNFKSLISKYSKGRIIASFETKGYYDQDNAGEYVKGDIKNIELLNAAIVPLTNEELSFKDGGAYEKSDRKLYCYSDLPKSAKIINEMENGNIRSYTLLEEKDYSDFDKGLRIYVLRRSDKDDK